MSVEIVEAEVLYVNSGKTLTNFQWNLSIRYHIHYLSKGNQFGFGITVTGHLYPANKGTLLCQCTLVWLVLEHVQTCAIPFENDHDPAHEWSYPGSRSLCRKVFYPTFY